jgi:hypothetical protein
MKLLCSGLCTALAICDNELVLLKEKTVFSIFKNSFDLQIRTVKPSDIILHTYNENGENLAVVTKQGLIIFFCFGSKKGHEFEKNGICLSAIYKTMRVIFSGGKILSSRCALEDQFLHSVNKCPLSKDGIILVPFELLLGQHAAVVRVQAPEKTSCMVRMVFDTNDYFLDELPTRQPFISDNWNFVYEQGILTTHMFGNVIYILTHTCIALCNLKDHDPIPILLHLPYDRINMEIVNKLYITFSAQYNNYCQSPIEWVHCSNLVDPLLPQTPHPLIPVEWEVVYSSNTKNRPTVHATILSRNATRPRLDKPLRDSVQMTMLDCTEEQKQFYKFADLCPNATCPWRELCVTTDSFFLNTIDGVMIFDELSSDGWKQLIDEKTKLPICAKSIKTTKSRLFVQTENCWLMYDKLGNSLHLPEFSSDTSFDVYEIVNNVLPFASTFCLTTVNGILTW